MVHPTEALQINRHWRHAVTLLRVGYIFLLVMVLGFVVIQHWHSAVVLAVGVIGWVACALTIVTSMYIARAQHSSPKPSFWSMRWMLLWASVHTSKKL
jgi:hypothetical protein